MSVQSVFERLKASGRALLVLVLLLALGTGLAQDDLDREGYFEVRSASTEMVGEVHTLDARLQLVLSSEALAALESGVSLTIEMQMQVIRCGDCGRTMSKLSLLYATNSNIGHSANATLCAI